MTEPSAAQRRDRFEALFDEVYEPVQRYVRRRCSPASVDDVVSDVMLVLWRRLDEVPADGPLPWAYGVARRCLDNQRRSERRRLGLVRRLIATGEASRGRIPDDDADDDADGALGAALASMRPEDQELLRLWAWEELEPREIAVVLETTPNAVSIRLHRAKKRLAERMPAARKTRPPAGQGQDERTEEGR